MINVFITLLKHHMEADDIILQTYQQLKSALTEKLTHQGYLPVHEQHDDPVFYSRYIIWSNNAEALRLTWDGKEQWFALEVTHELPLHALSSWGQILITPVERIDATTAYLENVVYQILSSLE